MVRALEPRVARTAAPFWPASRIEPATSTTSSTATSAPSRSRPSAPVTPRFAGGGQSGADLGERPAVALPRRRSPEPGTRRGRRRGAWRSGRRTRRGRSAARRGGPWRLACTLAHRLSPRNPASTSAADARPAAAAAAGRTGRPRAAAATGADQAGADVDHQRDDLVVGASAQHPQVARQGPRVGARGPGAAQALDPLGSRLVTHLGRQRLAEPAQDRDQGLVAGMEARPRPARRPVRPGRPSSAAAITASTSRRALNRAGISTRLMRLIHHIAAQHHRAITARAIWPPGEA